ncbi:hypothetical protein [Actinoallomurus iriomotensis]|uniref:Uncharacterized protein n=1 Tax=Actinoallomurus iriomotensis TaxID=478107 RepID=A0A9W6VMH7_9ACTN|nr:hypothetical protein [Actinoallomurus iriomotensis]GLY72699.1 hypothetical protein Airi01_009660 [Actinoallomurus iriomotensis]
MLKKLTATGILAGAATGVILLGGPAHADRLAASPNAYPADCYITTPGYVPPAWCSTYLPAPVQVYPPTTYYPPVTYAPGYGYGYGWNRWHNGWHHWHR